MTIILVAVFGPLESSVSLLDTADSDYAEQKSSPYFQFHRAGKPCKTH